MAEEKSSTSAIKPVIVLGLIWITVCLLVNPLGDFPLNDDWSYARAVKTLIEDGHLAFTDWTAVPLLTQVLWGALFCKVWGFSFEVLRFSTLLLSFIGVWIVFALFRKFTDNYRTAFRLSLVMAFSPLYFVMSFTFMTDIPLTVAMLLSFWMYVLYLKNERTQYYWLGLMFAVLAVLIRPPAIAVPMAFMIISLIYKRGRAGHIRKTVMPFILVLLAYIIFQIILKAASGLPAGFHHLSSDITGAFTANPVRQLMVMVYRFFKVSIYLGLFLMPLILWWLRPIVNSYTSRERLIFYLVTIIYAADLAITLLFVNKSLPLLPNIFYNLGLGVATLRDVHLLGLPHIPSLPNFFWIFLTALSIISAAVLAGMVVVWFTRLKRSSNDTDQKLKDKIAVFTLVTGLLYILPNITVITFDRYLIPLIPLGIFFLLLLDKQTDIVPLAPVRISAKVIFVIFTLFSLAATHDYLAWNRARWQALNHLTRQENRSPKVIDGGFEYNGWFLYDYDYQQHPDKSWWWVEDDEYLVSFGPVEGYYEIGRYEFTRWLPPRKDYIYLLHRRDDHATNWKANSYAQRENGG